MAPKMGVSQQYRELKFYIGQNNPPRHTNSPEDDYLERCSRRWVCQPAINSYKSDKHAAFSVRKHGNDDLPPARFHRGVATHKNTPRRDHRS